MSKVVDNSDHKSIPARIGDRRAEIADLIGTLKSLLRILEAVRLSAGLGKTQLQRVESAKSILRKMEGL